MKLAISCLLLLLAVCQLPSGDAAGYKYIGCYIDTAYRDLPHLAYAGLMTISTCYEKCKALDYSYFGLQYYHHCFCGNTYGLFGISVKSKCHLPCNGNKDQICGGVWRNSVYSTGIVHTYPYKYLGCYEDKGRRDLPELAKVAAMSSKLCYEECKRRGYAYFGLQHTSYCFCGNRYGQYGKKPEQDCKMPCHGNKGEHCGGVWRNSLYATGLPVPRKPYRYRGCYTDAGARDLPHMGPVGHMSPDNCYKICKKAGYKHFGTQAHNYCFCGNSFGRYGKRPVQECATICTADKGEYCGGGWRNSIYTIGGIDDIRVRKPTYVGCFIDAGHRDLPYHALTHKMTVARCNRECTARKFAYFGLQASAYCFCGNKYGMYGEAARSDCRMPCDGDKSQTCGGGWRNSVWKTNYVPKFSYKYKGCYKDRAARDLPHNVATGDMSHEKCDSRCKKAGYKFFGVQYSSYCFCGNSFGKYGESPRKHCNMKCDGSRGQHCGGVWHNSVFAVTGTGGGGSGGEGGEGGKGGEGGEGGKGGEGGEGGKGGKGGEGGEGGKGGEGGEGGEGGGGGDSGSSISHTACVDPYDNSIHKQGSKWVSKATVDGMCYHYSCTGKPTDASPSRTDCMDSAGNCVPATASGRKFACRSGAKKGKVCTCVLKDGFTYVVTHLSHKK